jgi:serine/threonine protein kinase
MTENLKALLKKAGTRPVQPGQSSDALVGTRLGDEYQVLELLGQGAMAKVYKAHQVTLDRLVAIKILTANTPDVVARFVHEIKVHSLLKHINIVEALDCVTDARSGQTCFVMEYLEGTSLQFLVRNNPLGVKSEEDIFFILSQVASALNYAHRQGVIHRDLKPANLVMVEKQGEVQMKVVDFGMARLHEQIQRFTKTGHIVGSPLYMSPEQCLGKELDPRSDVYALGLVTYELATGKAPYAAAATLYEVMQSHCDPEKKPEPVSLKNQTLRLCDRLDAILYIALETDPEKRFQTVKLFEEALKNWYQGVQKNMTQDELDLFPICTDDLPGSQRYVDPKTLPLGKYKKSAETPDLASTDDLTIAIDADTGDDNLKRRTDTSEASVAGTTETKPRSGWRLPEKVSSHTAAGFGVVSGQELSFVRQSEPMVGTVMNNRYRVHEIIGEGGFSVVYRAQDQQSGKMVALKSLKFADGELSERFSREIKLHLDLKHPNIVKALERVQIHNQTYFVMELLSGTALDDYLEREFCVSDFNDICAMVSQLLDALEFAHDQGVIHRDLKPGNIMLIEQGGVLRVKVLDFGLAQIQDEMQRLTRTGMLVGSPAYMSPEHCLGRTLTIQSDIYSLGILTYELISGNLPYDGDSDIAMVKAHCDKNTLPMPLSQFRSDLPATEEIEGILARAMSKLPEDRYQEVAELRKAFDSWWQSAGRDAAESPFKEKRRRRRKAETADVKEAAKPQSAINETETANLSSIVNQYREAQTETVVKKWRGGARADRSSTSMVKMVVITLVIFCFLGTIVWVSMQSKPTKTVQEPTTNQESAATEAVKRVTSGESGKPADTPAASVPTAGVPEKDSEEEDESEEPRRHVKILGAGKYR